jgi:hypothetical protein
MKTIICLYCDTPFSTPDKRRNFCSLTCGAKYQQDLKRKEYLLNPRKCKVCNEIIPRKKHENVYCSRSCAASVTNLGRIRTEESKKLMSEKMIAKTPQKEKFFYTKIVFNTCGSCSNLFTTRLKSPMKYCNHCTFHIRPEYRKRCRFKLNNRDHSELFDGLLIKKYGWYTPPSESSCNYNGVTWDHLFPIHLGFSSHIDPNVMRHPANAELVPFSENLRRYRKQRNGLITLDQLQGRIASWDAGDRNLEKFYFDGLVPDEGIGPPSPACRAGANPLS